MKFNENDIRPPDLMKKKEKYLAEDIEFLLSRKSQFTEVVCPACASEDSSAWASKGGFEYEQCQNCRTIFMNPRAPEAVMLEFYKQSKNYAFWNKYIFPKSEKVRKEKIFRPRVEKVISYCNQANIKQGTLLEIGAAFGTFCDVASEYDFFERIIAVEPTPDLAETCRKKGIETLEEPVEKLTIPVESIDVIVNFEVIEHLNNPYDFLKQCTSYLKKGGLFICTCPNGEGLGTLILSEKASVVDHEHVNYFNPHSLSLLLRKCNLEVLEVTTPGELDLDLLKNAHDDNPELFPDDRLMKYLFESDPQTQKNFQEFVKSNLLSSHMWIIGRKPA